MSGQVYVFGNNYDAYLGLSNTKLKDKITFDKNGIIVQIASHAALSQNCKVYLWGSNAFFQSHIKHHDVKCFKKVRMEDDVTQAIQKCSNRELWTLSTSIYESIKCE